MFVFEGIRIDEALRMYLEAFRLPGEAPVIQHLMEHFSDYWHVSTKVEIIDLYQAVTILVMFPVSITVVTANIHCANMAPDYYFVQPQFGYNEFEFSKIKTATP